MSTIKSMSRKGDGLGPQPYGLPFRLTPGAVCL
jgi:hypothetical protein